MAEEQVYQAWNLLHRGGSEQELGVRLWRYGKLLAWGVGLEFVVLSPTNSVRLTHGLGVRWLGEESESCQGQVSP